MAAAGAGELAALVFMGVASPSPELLFSLSTALALLLALLPVSPLGVPFRVPFGVPFGVPFSVASAESSSTTFGLGALQVGIPQTTPVKLFSWNGLRSHLRHGLPVRSRARRPALIAPWLAFGPSLCEPPVARPPVWPSVVPSSLRTAVSQMF